MSKLQCYTCVPGCHLYSSCLTGLGGLVGFFCLFFLTCPYLPALGIDNPCLQKRLVCQSVASKGIQAAFVGFNVDGCKILTLLLHSMVKNKRNYFNFKISLHFLPCLNTDPMQNAGMLRLFLWPCYRENPGDTRQVLLPKDKINQ